MTPADTKYNIFLSTVNATYTAYGVTKAFKICFSVSLKETVLFCGPTIGRNIIPFLYRAGRHSLRKKQFYKGRVLYYNVHPKG